MMALIGVCVATVAYLLHFLIHAFAMIKYHGTRWVAGRRGGAFACLCASRGQLCQLLVQGSCCRDARRACGGSLVHVWL